MSGRAGSGRVGSGRAGSGRVGSGRVGSGRVGSGLVVSDRVGPGRVTITRDPSRYESSHGRGCSFGLTNVSDRLSPLRVKLSLSMIHFTSTFVLGLARRNVARFARTNAFEVKSRVMLILSSSC